MQFSHTVRLACSSIPLLLMASTLGCSKAGGAGEVVRPKARTAADAMGGEVACAESTNRALTPLVVDLSGADRLDFEAQMQQGIAIVSYSCEGMCLLPGCTVDGEYAFVGVTLKEENFQLESADEVAANIPFSGGNVGAGMSRDQSLDLAVLMVGKSTTPLGAVYREELVGACEGATHSVRAATIGAFAMKTGTRGKVQASAALFGAGVESGSEASEKKGKKDGDPTSCKSADPSSSAPPAKCGALVRLDLMPIQPGEPPDRAAQKDTSKDAAPVESPCPTGFVMKDGKCSQDTSEGSHVCMPENLDECLKQCEAGNADSCFNAALRTRDKKRSDELTEKACEGGSVAACTSIGIWLSGDPGDPKRSKKLLTQSCEAGDARACSQLGGLGAKFKLKWEESVGYLKRACLLGERIVCEFAANELIKKDVEEAQTMLGTACMAGDTGACARAVPLYMGDKVEGAASAGKKDEDRARKLAIHGCHLGSPSLCQNAKKLIGGGAFNASEEYLGVLAAGCFHDLRGPVSQDFKNAVMENCSDLARSTQRVGRAGDRLKALGIMCSIQRGGSSCNAYERESLEHAIELLRETCHEGDADACLELPRLIQEASCWVQIEYGKDLKTTSTEQACDGLRARDPARLKYLYQLKCGEAGLKKSEAEAMACQELRSF